MSAEDLGKKLLAEVEEVGLDEILNYLRLRDDASLSIFGLSALDSMIHVLNVARTSSGRPQPTLPIIELMTLRPDTGTSELLHHLIARSVLSTNLGGHQSCAIVIDADNTFSVSRLTHSIKHFAFSNRQPETTSESLNQAIHHSLKHIHIFHPQSLSSTIATLNALPSYLFDAKRHTSFDRPISFIALDSASSFYWQARSSSEDAALLANTSKTSAMSSEGYTHLAVALKRASRVLHAPILYTTRYIGPRKNHSTGFEMEARSFRPSLPPPWGTMPTVRLMVRRVEVRKLPVGATVEQARREDEARRKVVEKAKFEVFVNEWGIDEGTVRRLQAREADAFAFFAGREGFRKEVAG
ncbi:hypothetical protein DOTSEDRAFT_33187 [Dothistroma septosporum NZE10]|uniref:DNA recombination and repair protein Rad51-like C-terminal domain-containing protein n=1 Tax=Dothistroma septosporum (strain NZE10 / CBS 128990) TaxID=675120 RepID=N1PW69_DOTSN|nr:hypothetical protein DOTSEDRAFT_33187 [Dothistroma septosporum NZE10]